MCVWALIERQQMVLIYQLLTPNGGVAYRFNFTIPLLSVIGANYDKLFPVGSINNLQLQMTTANQTPISGFAAAVTTQPGITGGFTLSECTLNMKYIDIGDMASQILSQTLQDG